jgi:hypothetical protein
MKSCPTCNRTYPDDTLAFCLMDGSVLSAPYDPETKKVIPSSREPTPPRTEVMNPAAGLDSLPPTQAAKDLDSASTITSSLPTDRQEQEAETTFPQAGQFSSPDAPVSQNAWLWIGVGLAALFVLILLRFA